MKRRAVLCMVWRGMDSASATGVHMCCAPGRGQAAQLAVCGMRAHWCCARRQHSRTAARSGENGLPARLCGVCVRARNGLVLCGKPNTVKVGRAVTPVGATPLAMGQGYEGKGKGHATMLSPPPCAPRAKGRASGQGHADTRPRARTSLASRLAVPQAARRHRLHWE